MVIPLPKYVNADGLLPFLSMIGQPDIAKEVVLDFTALRRVSPAAMVALVATVNRWQKEGRRVDFRGLKECVITGYLQRMDAFKVCGVELPEGFRRHEAKGRFVPVRKVDLEVDVMGHDMAACIAPRGDEYGHAMSALYDLAWYVLTEAANNARQHSGSIGYATAQVTSSEGLVRLALADNGRGILRSFRDAGFAWSAKMDDAGAIRKALDPFISSKGGPVNEGVGLTLVNELARLTEAWLLIVSGTGVLRLTPNGLTIMEMLPTNGYYQGTLLTLVFRQDKVRDFAHMLDEAKNVTGLLRSEKKPGRFEV
jgi:hypothetical protein